MADEQEAKRVRVPRLASAMSPKKPEGKALPTALPASASAVETTKGGIAKTKFAPTVTARRIKKEPELPAEAAEARPSVREEGRPGRGRASAGRGRGGAAGKGLLGDRRQESQPAVASGPFSMGPTGLKGGRQSSATVGFAPPAAFGNGSGPGFGAIRAGRQRVNPVAAVDGQFEDETRTIDLEKMIQLERLALGDDYAPVNISCGPPGDALQEPVAPIDVLEASGQIFVFQLPLRIPEPARPAPAQEGAQPASDEWPEGVEGEFGKLLVHESGRLSLEVNGIRFFLELGNNPSDISHVSGSQSIVAIDHDYEQSFELGQVSNTFVASLDLAQCLDKP